jgi:FtsP/CotA-like multicopper oxidase with cupredoxin domain
MRTLSLSTLLLLLTSCTVVEEPPAADPWPDVLGLSHAVDPDPSDDIAEYSLVVGEEAVELVKGQVVDAWTYNSLTPGPLLQAWIGQTMRIHVTNDLSEPTTIHWHGLRIDVAMDGVVMGKVQAIEPGETFTYEFTPPDAGTYWYHPHVRAHVQVEAGLYGALIVHERGTAAPSIDADRIFVIDDVLLDGDGQIMEVNMNSMMTQMHGRSGNRLLINGQEAPLSASMVPGAVERWRLVNTANARTAHFRFPGLEVREIGADGGLWRQAWLRDIDYLQLPIGARAELEVRLAEGEESGSMEQVVLALDADDNVVELGFDRVLAHLDEEAEPSIATGHHANPDTIRPDPEGADTYLMEISAAQGSGGIVWMLNGRAWPHESDWIVPQNVPQIIEIRNTAGPEHPFHLHGQFFEVMDRNGSDADLPGLRDTVLVGGMDTVTVVTNFDNPGEWMVHCHILEHAELGMMTTVTVEP